MANPFTGVDPSSIGTSYDVAIGIPVGNTANMVGYTLQPGTRWSEGTDLQDEQHLVQIASPNATDRFTRYPKVTQGDWSGGERQVFFQDPTKFFSTDGNLNTVIPGNLSLFNPQASLTLIPASSTVLTQNHIPAGTDGQNVFVGIPRTLAQNNLFVFSDILGTVSSFNVGAGALIRQIVNSPFMNSSVGVGVVLGLGAGGLATNGIRQVTAAGAATQLCNDAVADKNSMTFFNGSIYYITSDGVNIRHVRLDTPLGNAPGIQDIASTSDTIFKFIASTPTSIYYGTAGTSETNIHAYDGSTSTRIGSISGIIVGTGEANGIMYLLVNSRLPSISQGFGALGSALTGYIIYQIDGSSISVFDDSRSLPPIFQVSTIDLPSFDSTGNIISDGRFLYVATPASPPRMYDLSVPGNPVYQMMPSQSSDSSKILLSQIIQVPNSLGFSPFLITRLANKDYRVQQRTTQVSLVASGTMTSSFIDFGAPGVVKSFRSVDVELVLPLSTTIPNPISLQYILDNQTSPTTLTNFNITSIGNLQFIFPPGVQGSRIQIITTITPPDTVAPPVIRSISVKANLGRTWTFTVACTRDQRMRSNYGGGEDTQGLKAQDKLANIINAYQTNAGQVVMYIASPTITQSRSQFVKGSFIDVPSGVEVVFGTIEDYKWETTQPGPNNSEMGASDIEGAVSLTVVESLQ